MEEELVGGFALSRSDLLFELLLYTYSPYLFYLP